jgi:formylglycine-generating enzyme required for sulfatase activity
VGSGCDGWRLPTEAEWECLARSGQSLMFAGGDDPSLVAWTSDALATATQPVCQLAANAWGLCDMSGNVWEWTFDRYGAYPEGAATDPVGPATGDDRVCRGGSWGTSSSVARVSTRQHGRPDTRIGSIGFRLVRGAPEAVR